MEFKKMIKENYKYWIIIVAVLVISFVHLPYYITAPGGTIDITNRIKMEGYSASSGSINMLYVSEYKATVGLCLYSLLNGYDINKNDDKIILNESIEEAEERNIIMRDNSLDVAYFVAYSKAGQHIEITSKRNVVIMTSRDNGLMTGDVILEAEHKTINSVSEIKEIISDKNEGESITFKILRDGKEKEVESKIYLDDDVKTIGVFIVVDYEYDMDPIVSLDFKNGETGSSGGLMLTLAIYNALSEEDVIKGRNIAGTGTISYDGIVGEIDGIKYKIMGAAESNMDVVFVPSSNYEEAIKTKEKYYYDLDIVKVDTFDEVITYLTK